MKKIFKNKGNFYHLPFATILIFGLIFIYSCSKEESKDISNTTVELRSLKSGSLVNSSRLNQDADFNNLARVVSIGVEKNKSFRKLLKQQALIQFDGDYDVLVSTIKDEQLITLSGSISVKSFLGNIYQSINASIATESNDGVFNTENDPNTGDPVISSPDDIIEYIISVYPIIQISIPVLAEEWDENIHIPVVTFIPEDYNEGVTDYFEGYLNDNPIAVDAVIPPNEPVLVISLNERFHGGSSIVAAPDVDITLSATTSPIGISLSWSVSNPNDDEIMGYRIYRKTLFSNSFEIVHDNIGKENTIYNDNNVDALLSYFYYVKAYNAMGESESSNIAQANAPDVPNAVADFSALHLIADEMELRWTHETGQFIDNTTLFKRVIGVDASYQQIGTFPQNVNEYFDSNVTKGKRVNYKIEENNNQGNSNPKYDFVQVPFRDVSTPEPIKIFKISYDEDLEGEIEGWGRGRPEIQVSIAKAGQSGEAAIVQSDLYFDMNSDDQTFNKLIANWLPSDWAEIYTFKVIEVDGGPEIGLTFSAGFDKKDTSKTAFVKGSIDVTIPDITCTGNEEVGRMEHRYSDPINAVLEFPMGGVKIHLSN